MTDQHDPVAEVQKQLDQGYPDTWRFDEDGPEIIGYAVRKEVGNTVNGPCDILVIEHASNGKLYSVWLMHSALINKLNRMRPQAGSLVGIRQLGERVSNTSQRTYMDYNVVVVGATENALSWDEPKALEAEIVDEGYQGESPEPQSQVRTTVPASRDDDW